MNRQKGQVVLILILIMTVGLAIGLAVIQRSLSDISTSSKVEQSSRAFSAAEAGIEKALGTGSTAPFTLQNNATAVAEDSGLAPPTAAFGTQQVPFEYPPLSKEEVAHIWLADPFSYLDPPALFYKQNSLDIYWGNSLTDKAALELTLVYYDDVAKVYGKKSWYLDQTVRSPANNFDRNANCSGFNLGLNFYQCKYTIGGTNSGVADPKGVLPSGLMLIRGRLLYNTTSQPLAVQGVGTCGKDCSLPPQSRTLISTGTSGETQRRVKLFQVNKVVPPYFDYAIFSAGPINK